LCCDVPFIFISLVRISLVLAANQGSFYGRAGFFATAPEVLRSQLWTSILECILPSEKHTCFSVGRLERRRLGRRLGGGGGWGGGWGVWALTFVSNSCSTSAEHYDNILAFTLHHKGWIRLLSCFYNNPVTSAFACVKLWGERPAVPAAAAAAAASPSPALPPWHSIGLQVSFHPTLVEKWSVSRSPDLLAALVDNMLIARGDSHARLRDPTPFDKLETMPPHEGGGWTFSAWLDLFAKSFQLYLSDVEDREEADEGSTVTDTNFEQQCADFSARARLDNERGMNQDAFGRLLTIPEVLRLFSRVCPNTLFSVSLEVICQLATPQLLSAVVEELNRRGIHVGAVSGYDWWQFSGMEHRAQVVMPHIPSVGTAASTASAAGAAVPSAASLPGPIEVKLLHSYKEIEKAVHAGRLQPGDAVLFNGGTAIGYRRMASGKSKQKSYHITGDALAALEHASSQAKLRLGIFSDEVSLDHVAAELLVTTVNRYGPIFSVGYASAATGAVLQQLPTFSTVFLGMEGSAHREHDWEHSKKRASMAFAPVSDMILATAEAENPLPPARNAWATERYGSEPSAMISSNF
jgi:hypothetical protein